jgi:reactive intermediate/imine deaminase
MMKVRRLNPSNLPTPDGPFCQAVRAEGSHWLFISGQVALNERGEIVGQGDVKAQTIQVLENLKRALAAEGADLTNITKVTVYLTDMAHRQTVAEVRASYFGKDLPASTLVEVKALAHPDFLIEVEAIAVL